MWGDTAFVRCDFYSPTNREDGWFIHMNSLLSSFFNFECCFFLCPSIGSGSGSWMSLIAFVKEGCCWPLTVCCDCELARHHSYDETAWNADLRLSFNPVKPCSSLKSQGYVEKTWYLVCRRGYCFMRLCLIPFSWSLLALLCWSISRYLGWWYRGETSDSTEFVFLCQDSRVI